MLDLECRVSSFSRQRVVWVASVSLAMKRASRTANPVVKRQQHCKQEPVAAPQQLLMRAEHSREWRLELFFKTSQELRTQLPFLRQQQLTQLNITNKSADDDLISTLEELATGFQEPGGLAAVTAPHPKPLGNQQSLHQPVVQQQQVQQLHAAAHPDITAVAVPQAPLDVCLHYSIKYNYDKTPERSLARLLHFFRALENLQGHHHQQQQQQHDSSIVSPGTATCRQLNVHVLLVSGGGKKKRFDTVAALKALQAKGLQQQDEQRTPGVLSSSGSSSSSSSVDTGLPSIAVAFNPYLPDPAAADEERQRLRDKLATGLVDKVYLQMGTDPSRLDSALTYIKQLSQQLSEQQPAVKQPQLLGSVFLPSRRLLAQMRFRPWNGVYLSEEYLSSVQAACAITSRLLAQYSAAGVVPLLESAVKTEEGLAAAEALLAAGRRAAVAT